MPHSTRPTWPRSTLSILLSLILPGAPGSAVGSGTTGTGTGSEQLSTFGESRSSNGTITESDDTGGMMLFPYSPLPFDIITGGLCRDELSYCAAYGTALCTAPEYQQWVDLNCRATCGLCRGNVPLTGTLRPDDHGSLTDRPTCADAIGNCAAYGAYICTEPQYKQWVNDNCRQTCGLCGGATETDVGSGTGAAGENGAIGGSVSGGAGGSGVSSGPSGTGGTGATGANSETGGSGATGVNGTSGGTGVSGGTGGTGATGANGTRNQIGDTSGHGPAAPAGGCVDRIENCAAYGTSVCGEPQYQQWVSDNCCFFCGSRSRPKVVDTGTGATSGAGGIKSQNDGGNGVNGSACVDNIPNCAQYSSSVCSDPQYALWVTDNCVHTCNKCSSGEASATVGGSDQGAVTGSCVDTIQDCKQYDRSVCDNAVFQAWVLANCRQTCNKCPAGTTDGTASGSCVDTIQDCYQYDASVCTTPQYQDWVLQHCAKTCNKCSAGSGAVSGSGTVTASCVDTLQTCNQYDPSVCSATQYQTWVMANCAATCRKCGASCVDTIQNCNQYDPTVCQDSQYEVWTQTYCAKTCNKCSAESGSVTESCVDTNQYCDQYESTMCSDPQYKPWIMENCVKTCNMCPGSSISPVKRWEH